MQVTLVEIDATSVRDVCKLAPHDAQAHFVAPNSVSIAQAYFHKEAWFRAIHADGQLAGFVMLEDWTRFPDEQAQHLRQGEPYVYLWRFMVDARHQGRGIGRATLMQLIERLRCDGRARWFVLSYVPGEGSPGAFYRSLGFVPTGEVDCGEHVMVLDLKLNC